MKKIAIVLGVAAVATFTGCRDQEYDAKRGKQVQDEPKSIETTPVTKQGTKPEEKHCTCAPGTKHTAPCTCGAGDCTCVVEKPVVTPPAPVEPEYTTYVVQNGDYLAKISKKYNVTIGSIKRLNGLKDDKICVGQKLKLPGKIDVGVQAAPATVCTTGPKAAAKKAYAPYTGATKEYVVKNGDTLGSVAYGNGLNIRQLKQLNNLTGDSLKIGQKLKVPAQKVVASKTSDDVKKPVVGTKVPAVEPKKPEVEPKKPEVEVKDPPVEVKPVETEVKKVEPQINDPDPPAATPVATTTYVVQDGEDLTRIAVDFGVTTSVIRELNNLGENDTVKPGQVLKLPAEAQQ